MKASGPAAKSDRRLVAIRPAERPDAAPLAELMTQLGYPTRVSEMEMRLETIGKRPEYRGFVAVSHGKVVGMIGTCVWDSYAHNSPNGQIIALVVSEKVRNCGVGRALVAAAEKDFADRNIKRIAVNTHVRREDAHAFYERLGYSKTGFRFVKELETLAD
ncbi:MAG TPA: GNAT family N-acetyltransferase [Chthoniobacterales bacterium]|nr:GNAT family N-acetyltransferase [Chthoniobacterales bacterium]